MKNCALLLFCTACTGAEYDGEQALLTRDAGHSAETSAPMSDAQAIEAEAEAEARAPSVDASTEEARAPDAAGPIDAEPDAEADANFEADAEAEASSCSPSAPIACDSFCCPTGTECCPGVVNHCCPEQTVCIPAEQASDIACQPR